MGKRFRLFREFLVKPFYVVVLGILAFLSHIETVQNWALPHLPVGIQRIILGATMNDVVISIFQWLSRSWGYLFLVMVSVAIFDGFYRKTAKYINEPIKAKITVIPVPNGPSEDYIGLEIYNGEKLHLTNCEVKAERILNISRHNRKPKELDILGEYSDSFNINCGDHKKVEIAEVTVNHFKLSLERRCIEIPPIDSGLEPGKYIFELRIFGNIDGRPMKRIDKTYQVEFHRTSKSNYLQIKDVAAEQAAATDRKTASGTDIKASGG